MHGGGSWRLRGYTCEDIQGNIEVGAIQYATYRPGVFPGSIAHSLRLFQLDDTV